MNFQNLFSLFRILSLGALLKVQGLTVNTNLIKFRVSKRAAHFP